MTKQVRDGKDRRTVIAMATPMKSMYTLKPMLKIPSSPEN